MISSADRSPSHSDVPSRRSLGSSDLPQILTALDGAGPLAANWLRAAVDTIAERQLESSGELPAVELPGRGASCPIVIGDCADRDFNPHQGLNLD